MSSDPSEWCESTWPGERAQVARALKKRRLEHGAVRGLARRALADLGIEAVEIRSGPQRAPLWPDGIVGSLTHCEGYCAAAVARAADVVALGIDAELATDLDAGAVDIVCTTPERAQLAVLDRQVPSVPWAKVVFSVKEAVYKAWYPVTGRWLDFEDVHVELGSVGRFIATVRVDAPAALRVIEGRFSVGDGLIRSAVFVAAAAPGSTTTSSTPT